MIDVWLETWGHWISNAKGGLALALLFGPIFILIVMSYWLEDRQTKQRREAFFKARPELRGAAPFALGATVQANVLWDVTAEEFVARFAAVPDVEGRGDSIDAATGSLRRKLVSRARDGLLFETMKAIGTYPVVLKAKTEDVSGASGSGDGGCAAASC